MKPWGTFPKYLGETSNENLTYSFDLQNLFFKINKMDSWQVLRKMHQQNDDDRFCDKGI